MLSVNQMRYIPHRLQFTFAKKLQRSACTLSLLICLGSAVRIFAEDMKDGAITGPFLPAAASKNDACLNGKCFFVNGMFSDAAKSVRQAKATADRLCIPTVLIFNDLTSIGADVPNMALSKLVGSSAFNEAYDTLLALVRTEIEAGRPAYLVGFSAGAVVVNDVVRELDDLYEDRPDDERKQLLKRVHVLVVGSPCLADENFLADGWPSSLGSVHRLFDRHDPVVQWFGEGKLSENAVGAAHDFIDHYLPHLTLQMLMMSGSTVLEN